VLSEAFICINCLDLCHFSQVNGNLVKNQEMWIETIRKAQAR